MFSWVLNKPLHFHSYNQIFATLVWCLHYFAGYRLKGLGKRGGVVLILFVGFSSWNDDLLPQKLFLIYRQSFTLLTYCLLEPHSNTWAKTAVQYKAFQHITSPKKTRCSCPQVIMKISVPNIFVSSIKTSGIELHSCGL